MKRNLLVLALLGLSAVSGWSLTAEDVLKKAKYLYFVPNYTAVAEGTMGTMSVKGVTLSAQSFQTNQKIYNRTEKDGTVLTRIETKSLVDPKLMDKAGASGRAGIDSLLNMTLLTKSDKDGVILEMMQIDDKAKTAIKWLFMKDMMKGGKDLCTGKDLYELSKCTTEAAVLNEEKMDGRDYYVVTEKLSKEYIQKMREQTNQSMKSMAGDGVLGEAIKKAGNSNSLPMPDSLKMWIDKKDLFVYKSDSLDEQGKLMYSMKYNNIKTDAKPDPKLFAIPGSYKVREINNFSEYISYMMEKMGVDPKMMGEAMKAMTKTADSVK